MSYVAFVVFGIAAIAAIPIAHALLLGALAATIYSDRVPLNMVVEQMVSQVQSFPLIAIPFFILTGALMMGGNLGKTLVGFMTTLLGRFHGGPAQVGVLSSAVFGGVSGSAVADASALGSMLIPWQKSLGYPGSFAAATLAAAATIDILIPPSIPLIIFALVSNASIGALFLAGLLPGLMLTLGFIIVCNIVGRNKNYPREVRPISAKILLREVGLASPALALPVLIIIFLRFGVATPTEVSVVSSLYAGVVSAVIYRDLTLKRIRAAVLEAGVATGVVLLVIMASSAVGWIVTYEQLPAAFADYAKNTLQAPWLIIAAMNVIMLFAGMFIDLPAAVLLLTPIFVPLAAMAGMDTVQLGVMMVVNLALGLYTPPVGTTLFITSSIAKVKIGETVRALVPFYFVALTVLLLMSYVPAMTIR